MHSTKTKKPKLLLMGYNGANNTGSEVRLLAIIEDIRAVLGYDVEITVPSLNPTNLRRYIKEGSHLKIAPVPSIYFFTLRKLVKEHDIVLLVEGSCYMDSWASALLWAFLWVSKVAHKFGKPTLAYSVDSGDLSQGNQRRVQRVASNTDLIIARTPATAEHLKAMGVTAPIKVTADTSLTFNFNQTDEKLLNKVWKNKNNGVVGLAVLDFNLWPVVARPLGKKTHCYRWPYYYSRSSTRCQASDDLAKAWAEQADKIIKEHDRSIALICMESLDEPLAEEVRKQAKNPGKIKIFSSSKYNASEMTGILRDLDLLITSRYHAGVLSLKDQVPQIAIGHDTRLKRFYQDIGLLDQYYFKQDSNKTWKAVDKRVNELLSNPTQQKKKLIQGYKDQLKRAKRNRILLKEFLVNFGWL
jgi:polysaccharide pyruvyl transferase WcaK-like protein